ncbi:MAG: HigA family addiction module antitoxin [Victivallaceae bacterium]|jgi:addiction module HigA family antidote
MNTDVNIIHPGEILDEEFLKPMRISQNRLAMELRVPARRINEIVLGRRGISADTAVRLSKYFGNSAEFWMRLQEDYELRLAKLELSEELNLIRHLATA